MGVSLRRLFALGVGAAGASIHELAAVSVGESNGSNQGDAARPHTVHDNLLTDLDAVLDIARHMRGEVDQQHLLAPRHDEAIQVTLGVDDELLHAALDGRQ
jgi:hypothetical protein